MLSKASERGSVCSCQIVPGREVLGNLYLHPTPYHNPNHRPPTFRRVCGHMFSTSSSLMTATGPVPHLLLPAPQAAQITQSNAYIRAQVAEEAAAATTALGVRIDEVQSMMEDEVHQMDEFVEAKLQQVCVRARVCGCMHACASHTHFLRGNSTLCATHPWLPSTHPTRVEGGESNP